MASRKMIFDLPFLKNRMNKLWTISQKAEQFYALFRVRKIPMIAAIRMNGDKRINIHSKA